MPRCMVCIYNLQLLLLVVSFCAWMSHLLLLVMLSPLSMTSVYGQLNLVCSSGIGLPSLAVHLQSGRYSTSCSGIGRVIHHLAVTRAATMTPCDKAANNQVSPALCSVTSNSPDFKQLCKSVYRPVNVDLIQAAEFSTAGMSDPAIWAAAAAEAMMQLMHALRRSNSKC